MMKFHQVIKTPYLNLFWVCFPLFEFTNFHLLRETKWQFICILFVIATKGETRKVNHHGHSIPEVIPCQLPWKTPLTTILRYSKYQNINKIWRCVQRDCWGCDLRETLETSFGPNMMCTVCKELTVYLEMKHSKYKNNVRIYMPGIQYNNCPCAHCCIVLFPWNWYTYYGHLHQVKTSSVRPEAHASRKKMGWNKMNPGINCNVGKLPVVACSQLKFWKFTQNEAYWNFTTLKLTLLWGWPLFINSLPLRVFSSLQFLPSQRRQKKGSELQLKVVPNPAHQIQVSCDSACRGHLHCWPMPGTHQFDHGGSTCSTLSKYVWIICFVGGFMNLGVCVMNFDSAGFPGG